MRKNRIKQIIAILLVSLLLASAGGQVLAAEEDALLETQGEQQTGGLSDETIAAEEAWLEAQEEVVQEAAEETAEVTFTTESVKEFIDNGVHYLYFPSEAQLDNLVINYTGSVESVTAGTLDVSNATITINAEETQNFDVITESGAQTSVAIAKSQISSMSIALNGVTLQEIHKGDKDQKYGGNSLVLSDPSDAANAISAEEVEIKGRGNTTWHGAKKPYQIKFDKKTSVLGMEKAKKWVLLANFLDGSLMQNKVAFDLAAQLGMVSMDSRYIDLWIDGEYLGNYLICEKIEIGSGRVDLAANDGVVVEGDNHYYESEDVYQKAENTDSYFVLKESVADDVGSGTQSEAAFGNFMDNLNAFEKELYHGGSWESITQYIDPVSFAQWYLVKELAIDGDAIGNSMYFYKDGANDKIHMGPVWDFDYGFGNVTSLSNTSADYYIGVNCWFRELYQYQEFRTILGEQWQSYRSNVSNTLLTMVGDNAALIGSSVDMNYHRWKTLGSHMFGEDNPPLGETYEACTNKLQTWIEERSAHFDDTYTVFEDVKKSEWYFDAVYYVYSNGIMTGYDLAHFGPADQLSRGQLATILYRMAGSPEVTYSEVFPDVPDGQFYTLPVLWAKQSGIINGYEDGNFGPNDNITREQIAVFLHNYSNYKGNVTAQNAVIEDFPDASAVSTWAVESMQWAVANGIITGSGGQLKPIDNAARAECAAMMQRFMAL